MSYAAPSLVAELPDSPTALSDAATMSPTTSPLSPAPPLAPSHPAPPAAPSASSGSAGWARLPTQHFSGNPLARSSDAVQRFEGRAAMASDQVSLIVVAGREVCMRLPASASASSVIDPGIQDIQALLLGMSDPQLNLNADTIFLSWTDGDVERELPLYLLGLDKVGPEQWTFALDVSEAKAAFLAYLANACELKVRMADLRTLLPSLSRNAAAIAGQAVALSQWHQTHKFCHRCGAPTTSAETGLRRRCTATATHKMYPRTDPVVIMLVESPDGTRALLGRNHQFTAGMYTCLSGFIDQCEGVEEAVRREVREEARVEVDEVQIAGTQPWPIGRAGSCELMLGCMAKARSYEIFVNASEMEDVQWYSREELRAVVGVYDRVLEDGSGTTIADVQAQAMAEVGFFVPPPLAIAHHLIRMWAAHDGPWFPRPAAAAPLAAAAPASAPMPALAAADAEAAAVLPVSTQEPGAKL